MNALRSEIRPGAYYDSVVLMQLQRALAALPGVIDAGVVMATPANLELLAASALLTAEGRQANPDDLLLVIKAETEEAAEAALAQVESLLQQRRVGGEAGFRPKSLATALRMLPHAQWVLISAPGRFAAGVARQALALGRHVFLYSDNVSLADEVALKQAAWQQGLLVMGPDCGTAIIQGVGLGFANRVRRGVIGLVGASGTGLQAITSHIHQLGGGVSQAIGVGGRDLSQAVGGLTARQALDLLGRDPATQVIVLMSKPPAPAVAAQLLALARSLSKPVVVDFIGYPPPARRLGNVHFAATLRESAELSYALSLETPKMAGNRPNPFTGYVRGLFSGGTLAYEAVLALQGLLVPLYTNTPIQPAQALADPWLSQAHTLVDMGADEFTQGRLHPMLDQDTRIRRLRQEAADPAVGFILLDVVLGAGAHPDPAAELAPVVAEIKAQRDLPIGVILVGTDDDPQSRAAQAEQFLQAGALLFEDTTAAAEYIARHAPAADAAPAMPVALDLLQKPLAAVNIGLESFYTSLLAQGADALQVEWRPPAGGNEKMAALLARLRNA